MSVNFLFALTVAGAAFGSALVFWFGCGVWWLHRKGEASLGAGGWMALIFPPSLLTICLVIVASAP